MHVHTCVPTRLRAHVYRYRTAMLARIPHTCHTRMRHTCHTNACHTHTHMPHTHTHTPIHTSNARTYPTHIPHTHTTDTYHRHMPHTHATHTCNTHTRTHTHTPQEKRKCRHPSGCGLRAIYGPLTQAQILKSQCRSIHAMHVRYREYFSECLCLSLCAIYGLLSQAGRCGMRAICSSLAKRDILKSTLCGACA